MYVSVQVLKTLLWPEFRMCKNNTGLYKLLELDQMFDLDELFNLTKYNQLVDEQFDQIGAVLNGTLDGFLSEDDIANIEVLKSESLFLDFNS